MHGNCRCTRIFSNPRNFNCLISLRPSTSNFQRHGDIHSTHHCRNDLSQSFRRFEQSRARVFRHDFFYRAPAIDVDNIRIALCHNPSTFGHDLGFCTKQLCGNRKLIGFKIEILIRPLTALGQSFGTDHLRNRKTRTLLPAQHAKRSVCNTSQWRQRCPPGNIYIADLYAHVENLLAVSCLLSVPNTQSHGRYRVTDY